MLFALGNKVKFLKGCNKWQNVVTGELSQESFEIESSLDIAKCLSTCPFKYDMTYTEQLDHIGKWKTVENMPFTKTKDCLQELRKIWEFPLYKTYFGMVKGNDGYIVYSDDFRPEDGFVRKNERNNDDFLNSCLDAQRCAAIIAGNDMKRKKIVEMVLTEFVAIKTVVISPLVFDCCENFPNVSFTTKENFYQEFSNKTQHSKSIGIVIIDCPGSFNARSKYCEFLFSLDITNILLLYENESLLNFVPLSRTAVLKELVPNINRFRFLQHNVIRLKTEEVQHNETEEKKESPKKDNANVIWVQQQQNKLEPPIQQTDVSRLQVSFFLCVFS